MIKHAAFNILWIVIVSCCIIACSQSESSAETLFQKGINLKEKQPNRAFFYFEKALRSYENQGIKEAIIRCRNAQIDLLIQEQEWNTAAFLLEISLPKSTEWLGKEHQQNLQLKRLEQQLKTVHRIDPNKEHPKSVSSISDLSKQVDKAKQLGDKNFYFNLKNELADAFLKKKKWVKMDSLCCLIMAESRVDLEPNNLQEAKAYYIQAKGYLIQGKWDDALSFFEKALEIREGKVSKTHSSIAATYNNMAVIYFHRGAYNEALALYRKAADLRENELKNSSERSNLISLANHYNNIGECYRHLKDTTELLEYLKKALELRLDLYGEKHDDVAASYTNIGNYHAGIKKKDALALVNYEKAARIREQLKTTKSDKLVLSYNNIGAVYERRGDQESALGVYYKVLILRKQALGRAHPNLAFIYNDIARVHIDAKKPDQGLFYANKALEANLFRPEDSRLLTENISRLLPLSATFFLTSIEYKAQAYQQKYALNQQVEHLKKALQHYHQSDTIITWIQHSYRNTKDQLNFEHAATIYTNAISCSQQLYALSKESEYLNQAFYFAEKRKATVLRQSIVADNALEFGDLPKNIKEQERKLQAEIIRMEDQMRRYASSKKDSLLLRQYEQDSLFYAKRAWQDFIGKLEQNYPAYTRMKYASNISTLSEIQLLIDEKTLVLHYTKDEKKAKREQLYIFSIRKHYKELRTTRWNPKTDNSLSDLYDILKNKTSRMRQSKWQQKFMECSHHLYQQLLEPIEDELEGIERLLIIGDDNLHYLPFELLLKEKPRTENYAAFPYLINDYAISYHYSATLFAYTRALKRQKNTNILAFAPVFSDSRDEILALRQGNFKHPFRPIPYSAEEVKTIGQMYPDLSLLLGRFATEKALVQELKKPYSIIHLASHSFANTQNPKFSGIACALSDSSSSSDGILHLGEIDNLAIHTDLLILSSCESGMGKLVKAEGLLGLNRSFIYAGAANVVFSLWEVDDEKSKDLMIDLHRHIRAGQSYNKALRVSKLQQIKKGALPNHWSTFLLIGE